MLERLVDELRAVVRHYHVGYLETTYKVPLDELNQIACIDVSIWFGFHPFGEVISGNKQELYLSVGRR